MEIYIFFIVLGLLIAAIPAVIANEKGYNYLFLWYLFGVFFFFPALICAIAFEDKTKKISDNKKSQIDNLEEKLVKLNDLYEKKSISKEEYEKLKKDYINGVLN